MAHDSAGGGQTVRLRLVVDVTPQRTALHPGPAAGGIDPHSPHRREVDDDPLVANGGARYVVTSAPYGDLQIVVAGKTHGRDHVSGPDASDDQARAPVNGTVPDCTGDVVVGVVGSDEPAPEPIDLQDSWHFAPLAGLYGGRCRHRVLLSPRLHSGQLDGHIGPPWTAEVKSRIWTSQRKAGAQHWRGEDVRPVLPHRPWRRDLRRALDAADHPQPVPWLRKLQRDSGGRARTLPYPALTTAQAARTARCRGVGAKARRARAPLRAHVCGPRPLQGLPVARRVGCALARDRPPEPRPFRGA